jgi:catechol 2,3-dioxygenase-like lactoylglutathione lyase family enzyme
MGEAKAWTSVAFQHIGITVSDIAEAVRFWGAFLGRQPRARARLDRPYLSTITGYQDLVIEAAFFAIAPGTELEILEYQDISREAVAEASANPGHMHLCLAVDDIHAAYEDALDAGAQPLNGAGPVRIDGGPNEGAWATYLRVPPDNHTFELWQRRSETPELRQFP